MADRENKSTSELEENISLHEMFQVIGNQMTARDVRVLKYVYSGIFSPQMRARINDGATFFLALEKIGRCDASNFKHILHLLRIISRHDLTQYVSLRRRYPVKPDPVDEYLEESSRFPPVKQKRPLSPDPQPSTSTSTPCFSSPSTSSSSSSSLDSLSPAAKRPRRGRGKKDHTYTDTNQSEDKTEYEIKKKVTCDIRLRVRAEYCQHDNALEGNVFSNKPELIERQFEKFMQANTILKSRDLGSIICDIKFSELTYLDAFWRDYINGSLLEALKGVFITESLKQAVGHEAIKLLVNVDEDDYEAGRLKLLRNLQE